MGQIPVNSVCPFIQHRGQSELCGLSFAWSGREKRPLQVSFSSERKHHRLCPKGNNKPGVMGPGFRAWITSLGLSFFLGTLRGLNQILPKVVPSLLSTCWFYNSENGLVPPSQSITAPVERRHGWC